MKIAPHKSISLVTAIALLLSICSYAVADNDLDDRYDDVPVAERFKLRIGGFLIDSFDTTVRFDSTQYPCQHSLSAAGGTLAKNGRAYSGTNSFCLKSATSEAASRIFNYYSSIVRSNMSASVSASTR